MKLSNKKRFSQEGLFPFLLIIFISLFNVFCTEQKTSSKDQIVTTAPIVLSADSGDSETDKDTLTAEKVKEEKMIPTPENKQAYAFKYDLGNPDFKGNLPGALLEISALTFNTQNKTLLAVNDELGNIYTLNAKDFSLIKKVKFGSRGDYEGIEIIGNTAYILKANGNISAFNLKSKKADKPYKTPLSTTNDVEGLGYDRTKNELILACKGTPGLSYKSKLKHTKAFYAFDLNKKKLKETPIFTISDEQLEKFLGQHPISGQSKKAKKKLKHRLTSFSPSAIAQHPKDGYFYILSSVGKLLVICNTGGQIIDIIFLSQKKFAQTRGYLL